ncbi:MAG: AAA family ATPase, partial [Bdellovibrionota bacterium]
MSDLFEASGQMPENQSSQPLAESLRPKVLQHFIGQNQAEHKLQNILKNLKDKGFLPNLILWGPPGTGKTTWARLIGQVSHSEFLQVNAIETGAKEIREIGLKAHRSRIELQRKTILFIDEIHRLNRGQQDVLLPFTEKGDIYLIGATTENPSYELNSALLSRCQVIVFERLTRENLRQIMS